MAKNKPDMEAWTILEISGRPKVPSVQIDRAYYPVVFGIVSLVVISLPFHADGALHPWISKKKNHLTADIVICQ